MVTVGSIFGGKGKWISYLFLSTLKTETIKSLSLSLLPNSHPFLYVSWCQVLVKVNHKLCELLNMNHVFRMIGISINNLSTPGNLEGIEEREGYKKF